MKRLERLQTVSSPWAEPKGVLPGQIAIHGVGDWIFVNLSMKLL